jgi:L-alanine-DL-glutamate epimerase-like enolase superfamily enzyme
MKIRRLETFTTPYVGFVRVTSDSGEQGWGQVMRSARTRWISLIHWR